MPEATTVNPAPARAGRPPPLDAERVLELAARSLFDVFDRNAKGTMVVDRNHRIVWISEGYKRFLPALGHDEAGFVGQRVEEVVPNTLIGQAVDSGQPFLVDLLTNQAGTFLGSRLPLRNDAGEVIGTVGYVLLDHPESATQPLVAKFAQLQHGLGAARREIAQAWRPKHSIASFIGSSAAALEVKRLARRVALTDSAVLLLGETGTGKELLAHGIHAASRRAGRALVSVNIAAVPDTLLEAEFFGVAPGAERKGRDGKFKLADGGTLLSAERAANPAAAAARTAGRPRSACPCAGRRHCAAQRHGAGAAQEPVARRAGAAGRAAVARQHSRAAQRARTGHADDR
jgi:transcriptional regulator with PAS, ATPase and Fis domain